MVFAEGTSELFPSFQFSLQNHCETLSTNHLFLFAFSRRRLPKVEWVGRRTYVKGPRPQGLGTGTPAAASTMASEAPALRGVAASRGRSAGASAVTAAAGSRARVFPLWG